MTKIRNRLSGLFHQKIYLLWNRPESLLLKKLVKNAAKYQIKHSYSLFFLPSSLFLLPSSFFPLPSSLFLLPSSFFPLPSSFFAMVLKRYTPPTCTLEITAKSSPLSRWAGEPVFKSLSFELRLDDPRLPDTQHVTLRGDRIQLETLHEAVSTYVQNLLGESRDWENNLNSEIDRTPAGPDSPSAAGNALIFDRPVNTSELSTSNPYSLPTAYLPVPPRLQPRGFLAHNLFLGFLSAAESGPVVPLSTLQLFDLATALDNCAAEVMALPNLNREPRQPLSSPWLKVAALLVASAGLTTGTIKMLHRPATSPQTATAPAAAPAPGNPQLAAGVSPSPVPALPTPPAPKPPATNALPPLPPPPINTGAFPQPQPAPHRPRPNSPHQQTQPHPAATPAISRQRQRSQRSTEPPSFPSRANNHYSRTRRTAPGPPRGTRTSTLPAAPTTAQTSSRRTAPPAALPVCFPISRAPAATLPPPHRADCPPRQYRTPSP